MVSVIAGKVITDEPKAPVVGVKVIEPLVALAKAKVPTIEPATPKVGVAVNAGVEPARTSPATGATDLTTVPSDTINCPAV